MYDSPQQQAINQMDIKKMATNSNNGASVNGNGGNGGGGGQNQTNQNTNQSAGALNHNGLIVNKQQGQLHLQQATNNNNNNNTNNNNNNNNNVLLQKQILQHYSAQSDLEELTSQEISLDLQHLIDDQFRDQEGLSGIFSDLVPNTQNNNNNNNSGTHANANQNGSAAAAKVLQLQQQQQRMNQQVYPRAALAYMPQAVHTGATYASNNSSDENSSIGSDATNIKEVRVLISISLFIQKLLCLSTSFSTSLAVTLSLSLSGSRFFFFLPMSIMILIITSSPLLFFAFFVVNFFLSVMCEMAAFYSPLSFHLQIQCCHPIDQPFFSLSFI